MLDISQALSSTEQYQQSFTQGLLEIMQHKTAGTFILACANIFQHPELMAKHRAALEKVYTEIAADYRACRSNKQQPHDAADDILVMDKIIDIGFEKLKPVQHREIETAATTYQLSFNQLRSFRPARMSKVKQLQLKTEFNHDGFHFNKPFLKKEMFAEGDYHGRHVSLLYNKFPFVKYHALLVVDKEECHSQYLTDAYLKYVADIQSYAQSHIPDLVVTYNSLGAGASVNHLHFQMFLKTHKLPIFSRRHTHNDGTESYPALCCVFTNTDACWTHLQQLHARNLPYNLLFKDGKIFCVPRKLASKEFPELNVASFGWFEVAGAFAMNNKDVFEQINAERLIEMLRSITADEISCEAK